MKHDGVAVFRRRRLKKVLWPNLRVDAEFQVLDILQYACGLKLSSALILSLNPFFEMASKKKLSGAPIITRFILFIQAGMFGCGGKGARLHGNLVHGLTAAFGGVFIGRGLDLALAVGAAIFLLAGHFDSLLMPLLGHDADKAERFRAAVSELVFLTGRHISE